MLPSCAIAYALVLNGSPRITTLLSEFRDVGLQNAVQLRSRDRDTEDGMRGCFQAHVDAAAAALVEMRAGRARVVFIFEVRHAQSAWRVGCDAHVRTM
jgi:hypothetical protein